MVCPYGVAYMVCPYGVPNGMPIWYFPRFGEASLRQWYAYMAYTCQVVLSAPLLFASFFILINALRGAAALLIQVHPAHAHAHAHARAHAHAHARAHARAHALHSPPRTHHGGTPAPSLPSC